MKKLLLAGVVLAALAFAVPASALTSSYHPADTDNNKFEISFPEWNAFANSSATSAQKRQLAQLFLELFSANASGGTHYYYLDESADAWRVTTTQPTSLGAVIPVPAINIIPLRTHPADTTTGLGPNPTLGADHQITFPELQAFLNNSLYTQAQKIELINLIIKLLNTGHDYYFWNTTTEQWNTSATSPAGTITPSITVLTPNGGETFTLGSTLNEALSRHAITVTWSSVGLRELPEKALWVALRNTQGVNCNVGSISSHVNSMSIGLLNGYRCPNSNFSLSPGLYKVNVFLESYPEDSNVLRDESDGYINLVLPPPNNTPTPLQILNGYGSPISVTMLTEGVATTFYVRKGTALYSDWGSNVHVPVDLRVNAANPASFTITPNAGSAGRSGQIEFYETLTGPRTYLTVTIQAAATTPAPIPAPAPVISTTNPSSGSPGQLMTVYGSNFNSSAYVLIDSSLLSSGVRPTITARGGTYALSFVLPSSMSASSHSLKVVQPTSGGTAVLAMSNSVSFSVAVPTLVPVAPINVPSITVLSPNGGEQWKENDYVTLSWRGENIPNNSLKVYLYLKDTNGGTCLFGDSWAVNGSYTLTPSLYQYKCPNIPRTIAPGNYKLFIISEGETLRDESDNYFTLSAVSTPLPTTATGAPKITSLTPASANAGASITVNGSNFTTGSWVTLNGSIKPTVTNRTATSITFTLPATQAAGAYSVSAWNKVTSGSVSVNAGSSALTLSVLSALAPLNTSIATPSQMAAVVSVLQALLNLLSGR